MIKLCPAMFLNHITVLSDENIHPQYNSTGL